MCKLSHPFVANNFATSETANRNDHPEMVNTKAFEIKILVTSENSTHATSIIIVNDKKFRRARRANKLLRMENLRRLLLLICTRLLKPLRVGSNQ